MNQTVIRIFKAQTLITRLRSIVQRDRWFVKVRVPQPLTRCDLTGLDRPQCIHGVFYIFTLTSPNVVTANCKLTMDGVKHFSYL